MSQSRRPRGKVLSVRLTLEPEWRLWPIASPCMCDDPDSQTGKRISGPFFSIWIIWSKAE